MTTLESRLRDAPDILAPPPLILLAAIAIALALEWLVPLDFLPGPLAPVPTLVGGLMVLGSIAGIIWCAQAFRRAGTNINPGQPTLVLVETGLYRLTRNPIYVGLLLIFPGIGLVASLDWTLPLVPMLRLVLHRGVVLREEAYLSRKFGAEYEAFRARTRRWPL